MMRKKRSVRLITALVLSLTLVCCFSVTAFAYADDTDQNLPVTDVTQPTETPTPTPNPIPDAITPGEPFEEEGNAYTRDLLYDKATNKQFITIQTKNGNTFYIVIDYDAPINDEEEQYQTYFLNMVDEADLLALMDEETAGALTTCTCANHCEIGDIKTDCPVCKTNMSECAGKVPEPETPTDDEPETPDDEQPKESSNMGMILGIFALAAAGAGGYYYFKFVKGKQNKDEDLDFYDDEGYEEESYVNEDAEPDIAEDDEEDSEDE